jgi:hypothetical protein
MTDAWIMDLHLNVTEFFHGAVTTALKSKEVAASQATEFYLVNLLTEFMSAQHLDDSPIALKMAQAKEAPTPEARARVLKEIGDTTLYMSGFFEESLTGRRGLVDPDYFISMGGSAYGQLASLATTTRSNAAQFFRAAYGELSQKFADFVAVLKTVRDATGLGSAPNLLKLCEEWVRTRSESSERRLRESGIVAVGGFGRGQN